MKSMTGFGKSEIKKDQTVVTCELKSVNQRFLDLQFKTPKECNALELTFRKLAQESLSRGRVEIFIQILQNEETKKVPHLNQDLLTSFLNQLTTVEIATGRDLSNSLGGIFQREDFLTVEVAEEPTEELTPLILEAFERALFHLQETREKEGSHLLRVLKEQQTAFKKELEDLENLNGEIEASHFERLKEKLSAFLKDEVNEDRLLTEVALVVEKGDIHEEVDRLHAHLVSMTELLDQQTAVGRQLDFLVQEMNREVNTIGSKSTDLKIKGHVVQMKTILEKFREQIQNIE